MEKGKKEAEKRNPMLEALLIPTAVQERELEHCTVMVGNVPMESNISWLNEFFKESGKIESITFKKPQEIILVFIYLHYSCS